MRFLRVVRVLLAGLVVAAGVSAPAAGPLAAPSAAAQGMTLSLSPLLVELRMEQGTTSSFDLVVSNEGRGQSPRLRVYTADIVQGADGDYEITDAGSSPRSAAQWIKLSTKAVTVPPGKGAQVKAVVTVPRGSRGGRYAAVVFEVEPEPQPSTPEQIFGSNVFRYRMVSVVEITIPDRSGKKQLAITGFSVATGSQDAWLVSRFGKQAVKLTGSVRNEGEVHVFAKGVLTLRTSGGARLRQIPLGSGRGVVLPDSTVELVSVLPAGLPDGNYIADISVSYGGVRPAVAKVQFTISSGPAPGQQGGATGPSPVNVAVEPEQVGLPLVPGALRSLTLLVTNREGRPLSVQGRVAPLAFTPEGEVSEELARQDPWSCAQWVALSPASFTLKPRGRQTVKVVVTTPKGEKRGGRYANIIFECGPSSGGDQGGGSVRTQVGTSLLATIGTGLVRSGSLARVEVTLAAGALGNRFAATFVNAGEVHVQLRGTFILTKQVLPKPVPGIEYVGPPEYVEVARLEVPEVVGVVLPGQQRVLSADLTKPLDPGQYRLEAVVNYGGTQPAVATKEFEVP